MNNILLSIIVPFKNPGDRILYSIKAISDVIADSVQVIYVDNGSTDDSRKLLDDENKRLDNKFTILEQNNQGVSAARNLGITHAVGDYVFFLDADDFFCPELINELKRLHRHRYDCILFSVDIVSESCSVIKAHRFLQESEKAGLDVLSDFVDGLLYANVESVIHRREHLINNAINFNESLSIGEDIEYNMLSFRYADSCLLTNNIKSYYVKHNASTSAQTPSINIDGLVRCYEAILSTELTMQLRKKISRKKIIMFCSCIFRSAHIRNPILREEYITHFVECVAPLIDCDLMKNREMFYYFLAKNKGWLSGFFFAMVSASFYIRTLVK